MPAAARQVAPRKSVKREDSDSPREAAVLRAHLPRAGDTADRCAAADHPAVQMGADASRAMLRARWFLARCVATRAHPPPAGLSDSQLHPLAPARAPVHRTPHDIVREHSGRPARHSVLELAHPSAELQPLISAPRCCDVSLSAYYSMTFEPIACVHDTPSLDRPHHSTSEPTDDWPRTTCHTADTAYPVFAIAGVMVSRRDVTAQHDSGFCEWITQAAVCVCRTASEYG